MKSELTSIANQYARALSELAAEQGEQVEQAILNDLQMVNDSIRQSPDFQIILNHPSVSAQEKKALLVQLFQGKIQELALRLIEMLCDKGRLPVLPAIETEYRQLLNDKLNIAIATITSAQPLSDEEYNLLKNKVAAKLGKKLDLRVTVDESLIGGLILRIGDEVTDGSVRGKLRALEKSLLSV
jgi:F-type H+-transporting ATPase subunit delta